MKKTMLLLYNRASAFRFPFFLSSFRLKNEEAKKKKMDDNTNVRAQFISEKKGSYKEI